MKCEVVVLAVSDVSRAKSFYEKLGWRPDADFTTGERDAEWPNWYASYTVAEQAGEGLPS
jgi:catechol 2,3-dioxygenase-like lactoylglutathione lyase family enzyme